MVLRYKDIHAFDNNKTMKIVYSMYRAGEVSVHRACCEQATQPYSFGGGGTIYPGSRPAGVTTRFTTSTAECKSGFATERNPVPVDTPPDEMASKPLHIGKPVTSRHCLDLLRAVRSDEIVTFSADGYGSYGQIIHIVWQILSPSKSIDVSVSTYKLPRSCGRSAKPAWPLGRELCQYEHRAAKR